MRYFVASWRRAFDWAFPAVAMILLGGATLWMLTLTGPLTHDDDPPFFEPSMRTPAWISCPPNAEYLNMQYVDNQTLIVTCVPFVTPNPRETPRVIPTWQQTPMVMP